MSQHSDRDTTIFSPWRSVAVSALIGALLGTIFTSTWQVAVETAQVLAGVVEYPPANAFYRYHVSAWSLIHQVCAVFLWLGIGERALSIALSGFLCAVTFSGMTLCCHAFSRQEAVSILAPLVWFALFGSSNAYGIVYPLLLTGTHHTYGVLGRAVALWLIGVIAHRQLKAGIFLLGLAPALHLTWGIYAGAVVATAWLLSREDNTAVLLRWRWAVAGTLVTVVSFALQHLWIRTLPPIDADRIAPYLQAFLMFWDGHRIPTSIRVPGTAMVVAAGFIAVLFFARASTRGTPERIVSAATAVAGVTGLLFLLLAQYPQWLPAPIAIAMPGRFANLALLLFPVLLLGAMGRVRGKGAGLLLTSLIAYVAWNWFFDAFLSSNKYGWTLAHWKFLLPLIGVAAVAALRQPRSEPVRCARRLANAAVVAMVVGIFLFRPQNAEPLFGSEDDQVIARARELSGLLITGPGLELIQLRTGQPILLNTGGLDQLPYVPASGPAMNDALEQVYGISILDPPEQIRQRRVGALPVDVAIPLFAQRTIEEWQAIAVRFGDGRPVSVLVRPSHELALPIIATSSKWRLYSIPQSETGH